MVKKSSNFLDRHWWVVVLIGAFFSAVIFDWAHLVIWLKVTRAGYPYLHFTFTGGDALTNLAPMFRDILDGHWWPADGHIYELRGLPNLWSTVDLWLAAPLLFIFRSVPLMMLWGKFFSAFIVTILLYILLVKMIGRRQFALVFAVVMFPAGLFWNFLIPAAVNNFSLLFNVKIILRTLFHLGSLPGEILLSKYDSLAIFPASIFYVLAFLMAYLALEKRQKFWTVLGGVVVGFTAYTYATNWIYLMFGLGIMALIFLCKKDLEKFKITVELVIISMATASLYLVNVININHLPIPSGELYRRLGGEITHAFRWSFWPRYIVYVLMAWAVWWTAKKKINETAGIFIAAFVLAAIAVFNIQVIVGFNPSAPVWWLHQLYFTFGLACFVILYGLYSSFSNQAKYVVGAVLLLLSASLLIRVVLTEQSIANYSYPASLLPKNLEKSFDWLNTHTPINSVVGSPSMVANKLIPVLTHNDVFLPVAVTSPVALAQIKDRLYNIYKLYNVSPDYLEQALKRKLLSNQDSFALAIENSLSTQIFDAYYYSTALDQTLSGRYREIPSDALAQIIKDYRQYPDKLNFLLKHYRLDYLYVSKYERSMPHVNFDKMLNLAKVYDEDGVVIYKINK